MGSDHGPSLPTFLIVSPGRTGSTWLHSVLIEHPDIFCPGVKEINYFAQLDQLLPLSWYQGFFSNTRRSIRGEASTAYHALSLETISRVRDLVPDIRIVIVLRNPISRIWSTVRYQFQRHFEGGEAIGTITSRYFTDGGHTWRTFADDEVTCLRRWFRYVPADRVFVGLFEDLARDPKEFMDRILKFLGARRNWRIRHLDQFRNGAVPHPLPRKILDLLTAVYGHRVRELKNFLRDTLHLDTTGAWASTPITDSRFEDSDLAWLQDVWSVLLMMARDTFGLDVRKYPVRDHGSCEELVEWIGRLQREVDRPDRVDFYEPVLQRTMTYNRDMPYVIRFNVKGFNIVLFRNRFYGVSPALGSFHLPFATEPEMERLEKCGLCFVTDTLDDAMRRIAGDHSTASLRNRRVERSLAGPPAV